MERRTLDDRYELIELVGAGGMAEVWRARDTRLDRDVAVKILSGSVAADASKRRRIEREARALAAANHPNIVSVYDYGEALENGGSEVHPYIVMELVDGPDLHRYLEDRGPLPVEEAKEIMRGVLTAIGRAHAAGVVHGDLKPGNIFIGSHGPKVGDFGVARILGEETGTTTIAATPSFAAPEVLRGERATRTSDVYSAACLAFQLLSGSPPYSGATGWEVAQKHLESPAPRLRGIRPDVPARIDAAVNRALDKNPRRRFGTVDAFAEAIDVDAESTLPETMPVSGVTATGGHATEVITRRGPHPARIALLGPLAGAWDAASRSARKARRRASASPGLAAVTLAVIALAVVAALFLTRDRGLEPVAVPDVIGKSVEKASAQLRLQGFTVDDVSYRPVTEGDADRVLETIPAADELVDPGSDIHVIASAYAATPQPVVTSNTGGGERRGGKGKGRKHRDD
jgi:eukaryotic-like serine/threonine-protein kinase